MVRFKNRHLLVEFISSDSLSPNIDSAVISGPNDPAPGPDDDDEDDDDDALPVLPLVPFAVPHPDLSGQLKLGDDGSSVVFRAVRANVLDIFGDEGWGRLASSFKGQSKLFCCQADDQHYLLRIRCVSEADVPVIYHSPYTTLTILRVARPHYRTLWASLTLLRELNGHPIIPRIVAVSGTIKKLQNRAIAYHRLVTAQMLSAVLAGIPNESFGSGGRRADEEKKMREEWGKEEEAMNNLED